MTPGLHPARLVRLMSTAVEDCRLDLSGRVVLTEAASGAYVVTPVLAAMAGAAEVVAVTRSTRRGSAEEITAAATLALAKRAGVPGRVRVETEKRAEDVARADIVTNSGHVRPIDAAMAGWMKPTAVVPLMYEAWELQPERGDLDLEALQARGVVVAGTNERHPAVDVFSFLGVMTVKLLLDAGVALLRARVVVLCDNPFADYLTPALERCGATVSLAAALKEAWEEPTPDAVVVALQPGPSVVIDADDAEALAERWPGAVLAQLWGDVDRAALAAAAVPYWPIEGPAPGHMGLLPSGVGPEPIVRLQAGGLKVGEVLLRPPPERSAFDRGFLDEL